MNIIKKYIFSDERGSLHPFELYDKNINKYSVKRIFIITDVPNGLERGKHAHKKCLQHLHCIKGKILIKTKCRDKNNEIIEESFYLNAGDAVSIDINVWASQTFSSKEDILLVLCSENFDKNDYLTEI